ncbi:MAG: glutamate--tRNA ligase family protein [Candidatus Sulfotelmatobacter sp.]
MSDLPDPGSSNPRVRFAPSPTGFLHVGSARTFIFNWLYARHHGGTVILRLDDTDLERNTQASVDSIFDGLKWLNLNWDEEYKQSERLDLHRRTAWRIFEKGHAYRDFTPAHAGDAEKSGPVKFDPKDLRVDTYSSPSSVAVRVTHVSTGTVVVSKDEKSEAKNREKALLMLGEQLSEGGRGTWLFNPGARELSRAESDRRAAAGEPFALRFRVPRDGRQVVRFDDAVYGEQVKAPADIEDFALLRSDGMPTYHLASCADDADLHISHIIRGQDHLSNTYKHVLIFEAAGFAPPQFAHLPLLVAPDGTKLSKRRHGPVVSVTTYRDAGFLAEAFINFLCLLGWSPKDNREHMTLQELTDVFSLEGINRSNAVVNFKESAVSTNPVIPTSSEAQARKWLSYPEETFDPKALWLNAEHIRALPVEELSARLLPIVRDAGFSVPAEKMMRITPLIRERIKLLRDVLTTADFFLVDQLPPYDPAELIPQKGDRAMALKVLTKAREVLANVEFKHDPMDQALRAAAQELGVKAGQMFQPIRVAVCGRKNAPPLFETLEVLGPETTMQRIEQALQKIA